MIETLSSAIKVDCRYTRVIVQKGTAAVGTIQPSEILSSHHDEYDAVSFLKNMQSIKCSKWQEGYKESYSIR